MEGEVTQRNLAQYVACAIQQFLLVGLLRPVNRRVLLTTVQQETKHEDPDGTAPDWDVEKYSWTQLGLLELNNVSPEIWQPVIYFKSRTSNLS